jgi:hypothetical protein
MNLPNAYDRLGIGYLKAYNGFVDIRVILSVSRYVCIACLVVFVLAPDAIYFSIMAIVAN